MKSYSQNREDLFVLDYFKGFKGTLLEIGANDGRTLSNSLLLIENDWKAHLLEPGLVFADLLKLYDRNPNVRLYHYGIGKRDETVIFYESGAHVPNGHDNGLVSTVDYNETLRWRKSGVQFTETEIKLVTFETFCSSLFFQPKFHFISIDAEGMDWDILQQINLTDIGCSCLIIEWNSISALKAQFTDYCGLYGLKLAHVNNENLIFTKNG